MLVFKAGYEHLYAQVKRKCVQQQGTKLFPRRRSCRRELILTLFVRDSSTVSGLKARNYVHQSSRCDHAYVCVFQVHVIMCIVDRRLIYDIANGE